MTHEQMIGCAWFTRSTLERLFPTRGKELSDCAMRGPDGNVEHAMGGFGDNILETISPHMTNAELRAAAIKLAHSRLADYEECPACNHHQ